MVIRSDITNPTEYFGFNKKGLKGPRRRASHGTGTGHRDGTHASGWSHPVVVVVVPPKNVMVTWIYTWTKDHASCGGFYNHDS